LGPFNTHAKAFISHQKLDQISSIIINSFFASSLRRRSKAEKTKREADNVNDTAASEKASAFVPKKSFSTFLIIAGQGR